jgi:hypothetical protein
MSTQTFWNHVALYNETLWLVQVVMIIAAAALTYRVFAKPGPRADVLMKAFLSFAFAWDGIVVLLVYIQSSIGVAIGVPLFVIVAVLFAVDAFTRRTEFRLPDTNWKKGFTFFWLLLVVSYPLIGWAFVGHAYPKMLLPLFPCPLTVFAIALVAAAAPRVDKKVFGALLPWALMGLPKCFGALDCYEDCILFAAGVYGLVVLVRNWKVRLPEDKTRQDVPI